ncbi:membrane transporter [Schizosaccharomyces octosporus yFS286]|uniref:Membrane transporter n=1 Tax=Schizosaccharomyces octosporus (strain yFS286) TaxID=483514 RepID=S9PW22_SCHOY|nr:membrane transporter [Schizosaccharomyces octosporus yFS286]EPX71668.1 membrane transporter [Schizosaccharomyces octosporus yFS286]
MHDSVPPNAVELASSEQGAEEKNSPLLDEIVTLPENAGTEENKDEVTKENEIFDHKSSTPKIVEEKERNAEIVNEESPLSESSIIKEELSSENTNVEIKKNSREGEQEDVNLVTDKEEIQLIPENKMVLVVPALVLCLFLAALDNTIVTVAIPTITQHFHDTSHSFWISTAYTLSTNAVMPAIGVLSNILGRNHMLYASIFLFMLGSALSGGSQSMIMLIISRAIQGVGGGGISSLTNIIISEITPLKTRPMYTALTSSAWGIALVLGPVLGGLICQNTTWRWIFFINLPVGGVAITLIVIFLRVLPVKRQSFLTFLKTFDFLGLTSAMTGVVLFLLGISLGGESGHWARPGVLPYIIIGGILIIFAMVYDFHTKRNPVLPPVLFKNMNGIIIMISSFILYMNDYLFSYHIPQYYQRVRGNDPLMSGVHFLPGAAVLIVSSAIIGALLKSFPFFKTVLSIGGIVCTAGLGSLISLDAFSPFSKPMGLITIFMFGSGFMFLPLLIVMQASFPPSLTPIATATLMFVRYIGGAIGITIGEVIFSQRVTSAFHGDSSVAKMPYDRIQHLSKNQRYRVITTYASAYKTIWLFTTIAMAVGTLAIFFVKSVSTEQKFKKVPPKKSNEEKV